MHLTLSFVEKDLSTIKVIRLFVMVKRKREKEEVNSNPSY